MLETFILIQNLLPQLLKNSKKEITISHYAILCSSPSSIVVRPLFEMYGNTDSKSTVHRWRNLRRRSLLEKILRVGVKVTTSIKVTPYYKDERKTLPLPLVSRCTATTTGATTATKYSFPYSWCSSSSDSRNSSFDVWLLHTTCATDNSYRCEQNYSRKPAFAINVQPSSSGFGCLSGRKSATEPSCFHFTQW